ncbi:hypothetical protein BC835DRAFT_1335093 [Cytidiella melzeri]|nr:hypothetical protein BC835DRAFT_1335093 [Cytidiella melzeri]
MRFSTSLVIFAAIVTGALQTVTVLAIPYTSTESHSLAPSGGLTSSKGLSRGTVDFTNLAQVIKREKTPVRPPNQCPAGISEEAWLEDWRRYVAIRFRTEENYKLQHDSPEIEIDVYNALKSTLQKPEHKKVFMQGEWLNRSW